MRGTPTPLSIAFFAADGSFVSATDMVPCLDGPGVRLRRATPPAAPYTEAIEVFAGASTSSASPPESRLLDACSGDAVLTRPPARPDTPSSCSGP